MSKEKNILKGRKGEDIAKNYLMSLGYEVLAQNYHFSNIAEIDIIARDKDTIVFVEVKMRTSINFGHPLEAVSKSKVKKIYTAALEYIRENNLKNNYRIDAISILGRENPQIEHIKNVGF